jgi:uncharacterized protein with HEPN domain
MSRHDEQRLNDMLAALAAIRSHLGRGELSDGLVFDAIRVRFIEIGEAANAVDADLLESEPGIPWREVIGIRHYLAHRYFDTAHSVIAHAIDHDLPELELAVRRMLARSASAPDR